MASLQLAEVVWKGVDHGDRMIEGNLVMEREDCAQQEIQLAYYVLILDCPPFFFAVCEPHVDLTQPEAVRMGVEAVLKVVSHSYHELESKFLLSRRSR